MVMAATIIYCLPARTRMPRLMAGTWERILTRFRRPPLTSTKIKRQLATLSKSQGRHIISRMPALILPAPCSKSSVKRVLIRSGALRLASRFVGNGVAIIMYHSVQDDPSAQSDVLGGMTHSTEVFRGQMEVIARHFRPVTLDDVLLFVRGEKELPPRSVVV